VKINDLLAHKSFQGATEADLLRVVKNCAKQRFHIERLKDAEDGDYEEWYVRANQGHTMTNIEVDMAEIDQSNNTVSECVHGTYYKAWNLIKVSGLSKMARQHIHLSEDFPGSKEVISGMRRNCEVAVFIDVPKALKGFDLFSFFITTKTCTLTFLSNHIDGIKLFRSANNVILSPGDSEGFIKPKYFIRVVDLKKSKLNI
jgi:2'-phosphotransferase